jgi:iron complex outermembrane receptor protein
MTPHVINHLIAYWVNPSLDLCVRGLFGRRVPYLLGTFLAVGAFESRQVAAQEAVTLEELSVTSPSPIRQRGIGITANAWLPAGVLPVATDTFSPVTVVTRDQITRDQPRTLGDALFDRPGISSTTYAPGAASRPIIRGLDNARVRIQENGLSNGGVTDLGEDHAVPINPLVANRIEVIRGPATLRYGSGAIGGVVSADSNRIPTFIPPGGVQGQVTTGLSTVDNGRLGAATVDAGLDGIAVHADGFKTASDSYAIPGGIQPNSATATQGVAFGISAIGDRGFVGFAYDRYEAIYQIPGGAAAQERAFLDPRQDRFTSKGEYRPLDGLIEVIRYWAGYSVFRHDENVLGPTGQYEVGAIFKNRDGEARLEAQHVPVTTGFGVFTGALGVQVNRRITNTLGESFLPQTDSRASAIFLFEELAVGNGLRFQAAGRIGGDRVNSIAALFPADYLPVPGADAPVRFGSTRRFAPKSASFGALQDLPFDFVASVNGSYVERAPTGYELYSQGPHEATNTFEIGNPSLRLERARTIEMSLRRGVGPLRLDATGFYTRYTDFIAKRETGILCGETFDTCGIDTADRQIVYTQANAVFYGAEIIGQYDAIPVGDGYLGVEGQFDAVRARFDDNTNVPRIPPYRIGGGIYLRADGWFARVNLLHAFDQDRFGRFDTPTPGYDDLRADLSYTHPLDPAVYGASEMTLGLQGRNLLDADIRNATSFKKDEILLPGRNLRASLTIRF